MLHIVLDTADVLLAN